MHPVRPALSPFLVALALAVALPAQQQRAQELLVRIAALPRGSAAWFADSLELVEAQCDVDLRVAMATAEMLWLVVDDASPRGAREATAAAAACVASRLEGPSAAARWNERCAEPPPDAVPRLRVHHQLNRARFLCFTGEHAKELEFALPAQAAAETLGDEVLKLRAAMLTMHATPRRGVASVRGRYDAAMRGPNAADIAFLGPWLLVEDASQRFNEGRLSDLEKLLGAARVKAEQQGNVRLQGMVECYCGNLHAQRRDAENAVPAYTRAVQWFERLGDRAEWASALDVIAFVEVHRGNFAVAEAHIAAAQQLIADRGFVSVEDAVLRTRLELAVHQSDGPTAAAISAEIQQRKQASIENDQRLLQVREQLRLAEERRDEIEARLRAEEIERVRLAQRTRTWLGAGMLFSSVLLVGVSWRSRRRLLRANAQLAEQVRLAEEAHAAQVRSEERMRQMQQAESLGTLAAGVAHDFNNLLTGVLGNAELLRRHCTEPMAKDCLDTIDHAARQAARLCRQLQTYGGDGPLGCEAIDLATMVRGMLPVLTASARGRVEVQCSEPVETVGTLGDAAQLEQVLLNLVVNAADARAKFVRISMARQEHADGFDGPVAVLAVEDDGDGMAPEVAQRIFDPFFTTRFPGRGLGLCVVHGVVRRHGGTIQVDSAPGLGSKFTIHLPLAVVPPGGAEEPHVVLPSLPPRRAATNVLIVDDDVSVGQLLVRMLALFGRQAQFVTSGTQALALLAALPSDAEVVAFVDLTMPEMDGAELIERLRTVHPGIRVVLMSGHTQGHVEFVAAEHRPDAVLAKPFQIAAVQAVLATVLGEPEAQTVGAGVGTSE